MITTNHRSRPTQLFCTFIVSNKTSFTFRVAVSKPLSTDHYWQLHKTIDTNLRAVLTGGRIFVNKLSNNASEQYLSTNDQNHAHTRAASSSSTHASLSCTGDSVDRTVSSDRHGTHAPSISSIGSAYQTERGASHCHRFSRLGAFACCPAVSRCSRRLSRKPYSRGDQSANSGSYSGGCYASSGSSAVSGALPKLVPT